MRTRSPFRRIGRVAALARVAVLVVPVFAGGSLALSLPAAAQQDWPNKPVRMISAGAAGGTVDLFIRIFAEPFQKRYGQALIADNRPGAAGRIATEAIAKAPADGYLLGVVSGSQNVIGPLLYKTSPYHPINDFRYIARFATLPNMFYGNKDAPSANVRELVAFAKANPGKLNYGSLGIGTSTHLTAVAFERAAGIAMTHVPYASANRLVEATVSGVVHLAFDNVGPGSIGQVRGGAVRAMAVTSKARWPALPEVPSVEEGGIPNFEFTTWYGFAGPPTLPAVIAERFANDVREMMREAALQERLRNAGGEPAFLALDDLRRFVESEITKWTPVVRSANVSLD